MYQKTILPNGIKVVTHDMKERDSVALGIWIGVGGRYEDDRVKGAAHFLEHIVFKGSNKYSCSAIKEQIEGVGGALNAFTSEEMTCFYAKIPSKHTAQTFDVLADMTFFPKIPLKEVEKERTVIIEEIKMYRDLPQYLVLENLDAMAWPNHPLGKNLAGTMECVSRMSRRDLKKFHQAYYTGANIVVAACGNIKHQSLVNLVKRKLNTLPKGEKKMFVAVTAVQDSPRAHFFRKDIEQMQLALGMPGFHDDHKDKYVLNLLYVILGGNMSSRLFNEVREKRGLAYSISCSIKALKDTGMFIVRAGVDNRKIVEAVDVVFKELRKMRQHGVSKDEFVRAKDYYLGQVLLGLEETLDHMLWIGEATLSRDKMHTLKDIIRKIKKITPEDVQRVAKDIIVEKKYNLAIVGPMEDDQEKALRALIGFPG